MPVLGALHVTHAGSMTSELKLEPLSFEQIDGWTEDELSEALPPFLRSCREIAETGRGFRRPSMVAADPQDWVELCKAAVELGTKPTSRQARRFFESNFRPFVVHDEFRPRGLFTGYFEPEALGDRHRRGDYTVPIYARPPSASGCATAEWWQENLGPILPAARSRRVLCKERALKLLG
jgi:membrane-bound lytic murein transglycosylase